MRGAWPILVALALAGQGCATIFGGGASMLDVEVEDAPPGTMATLRGVSNPLELRELALPIHGLALDGGSAYALGVSAPGRKPVLVILRERLSPFAALELAAVGLGAATLTFGAVGQAPAFVSGGAALTGAGALGLLVDALTRSLAPLDQPHVVVKLEVLSP